MQRLRDEEFATHVQPMAHENWATAHGNRYPETEAEWVEADKWAQILRKSFDAGEFEITWR